MSEVRVEKSGNVAVITMDDGENRHNPGFIQRMLEVFDGIEADDAAQAAVLSAGAGKYWSLGIDVGWMMQVLTEGRQQEARDFLYGLNRLSERILTFPMPVVAAINGHAFGDGAMLALVCDFRFMKAGRGFFCFPEVDINIPFMPSMLQIIRKAIPSFLMDDMILSGRRVGAAELEKHNVIVRACADDDELMRDALAYAGAFAKPRAIMAEHKKRMHKSIIDLMRSEDPAYIEPLILTA